MKTKEITVSEKYAGKRIDILTSELTGITRSRVQRLIKNGSLLVNSGPVNQNYRAKTNDIISIAHVEGEASELIPEPIPLDILYSDKDLAVVNKPPYMVVYPAAGHKNGTLMNGLLYRFKKLADIGGPLRPGVVHRLDKDTSGIMVIALDNAAYYKLAEQFRERTITRKYIALIYGNPKGDRGEISLSIGRSESNRKKMSTRARKGKEALTRWQIIERFRNAALIEARLKTGRTHQIRVHFASIGHPVLGDKTYGKKTELVIGAGEKILFPRQMLHAESLGFAHPASGEYLEFHSPLPDDMEREIKILRG